MGGIRSKYLSGKRLADSMPGVRDLFYQAHAIKNNIFTLITVLVILSIVIGISSAVSAAEVTWYILALLIVSLPIWLFPQRLTTYLSLTPKRLRLKHFRIARTNYSVAGPRNAPYITNLRTNKKISELTENELLLFLQAASTLASVPGGTASQLGSNEALDHNSIYLPNVHFTRITPKGGQKEFTIVSGPMAELSSYIEDVWDHGHVRPVGKNEVETLLDQTAEWENSSTLRIGIAYIPRENHLRNIEADVESVRYGLTLIGIASLQSVRGDKHFAANVVSNLAAAYRSNIAIFASLVTAVTLAFGAHLFTTVPGIASLATLGGLLLIGLLPTMFMAWDSPSQGAKKSVSGYQTTEHAAWDGVIGSFIAYSAFLIAAWWHGFSPLHTTNGSLLHQTMQTIFFVVMAVSLLFLVYAQRSPRSLFHSSRVHNRLLGVALALSNLLIACAIYTPLAKLFDFKGLPLEDVMLTALFITVFVCILELRRYTSTNHSREHILHLFRSAS